jgi:hypothetical protein
MCPKTRTGVRLIMVAVVGSGSIMLISPKKSG